MTSIRVSSEEGVKTLVSLWDVDIQKPKQQINNQKILGFSRSKASMKMSSYFQENDTQINPNFQQGEEPRYQISKSFSEDKIILLEPLSDSQQYNIPSNQKKGLNEPNFITFGKISEDEKIEIIQRGFQLQAERKISFKNYSESTDP